ATRRPSSRAAASRTAAASRPTSSGHYALRPMRIVVLGAGHVGRAIVDSLFEEHDITVIDTNADRLTALADRYDVRTVEGNGTTKRVIREAGIQNCSLFIASTSREE